MIAIPKGVRLTPDDLGFNARVINNGVTTAGNIVPWRLGFPFDTVVARVNVVAGVANFIPRIDWIDVDGVTSLSPNQPFLNPGSTASGWYYWLRGDTPRALSGTVATTTIPCILGAPYARLSITNSDAAPATFTFEVFLLNP